MASKRHIRMDVTEVKKAYPPNSRLRHRANGKTYQMGMPQGMSSFWMYCEDDQKKGSVSASMILRDFEKVPA